MYDVVVTSYTHVESEDTQLVEFVKSMQACKHRFRDTNHTRDRP